MFICNIYIYFCIDFIKSFTLYYSVICNFLLRSSKLTEFLSLICWKWGKKGKQRDMSDFDKGQIVMAG